MNLRQAFETKNEFPEAFDGQKLQMIIGILAITFPIVLIVAHSALKDDECSLVLSSISAYYYTAVGTYFTGVLFALAMAMFAYKGRTVISGPLATFAAIMAILVAVFPTNVDQEVTKGIKCLPAVDSDNGIIHYGAAILLFIALIIFCHLFRKSTPKRSTIDKNKRQVFIGCIIGMVASMVFMAIFIIIDPDEGWFVEKRIPVILIGESICLVLFGLSWLVTYTTNNKEVVS